jgi:hypothetical protein
MSFRKLAWVVPAAYLVHVAEERQDARPCVLHIGVTQQAVFNALFHSVTTVTFREYSPGLITSVLTVPLWRRLTRTAITEGRLSRRDVAGCRLVAGIVHAGVVARQVFFVGVPKDR